MEDLGRRFLSVDQWFVSELWLQSRGTYNSYQFRPTDACSNGKIFLSKVQESDWSWTGLLHDSMAQNVYHKYLNVFDKPPAANGVRDQKGISYIATSYFQEFDSHQPSRPTEKHDTTDTAQTRPHGYCLRNWFYWIEILHQLQLFHFFSFANFENDHQLHQLW